MSRFTSPLRVPVLLMVRELNLGGSERQLAEIAQALDRDRFEPHVGCFRPNGIRADDLKGAGVPVVEFPVRSFRQVSVISAARQLGAYIRQHGIRLVHTFDVPANLFGVPAARALSKAIVISSQRAHRDLTPGLTRGLLRLTDRMVDGIVVNCDAVRRQLIDEDRVQPSLIHLCYNGIDTDEFSPGQATRPEALRDASSVIGIVCALRPEKDLHTLLQAFAHVRGIDSRLKLAIVGSGPSLNELLATADRLGISDRCLFEPATTRVADWLRSIDVFVLPSRSEALSNSLMEAMACGCAVVASRVGGNVELVQDGRTGLLFESGNADELSLALRRLIENQDLRSQLGDAAAREMREAFSLQRSAGRMAEIYSALLPMP
ncbi:MAG TPA: glycosyltransferase [Vicinamibacterales bacterium]|nr:glycosyltransferase [Vicinamibacterales bacterium]